MVTTTKGTYRGGGGRGGGARRRHSSSTNHNNRYHHPYGILLHLLRLIVQEPLLMIVLCIWSVIAILGVVILSQRLQNSVPNDGHHVAAAAAVVVVVVLPDARYLGYTHEQLYQEFYHRVGRDGCSIYSTLALWDIFVMVPAYILLLGTLYVRVTRYTYDKVTSSTSILWNTTTASHGDHDEHHAYDRGYWNADRRAPHLLWPIALSDWTETVLQRRGCTLLLQQQPEELSNYQVQMASMAVSLKWFLLGVFAVLIMERFVRVYGTAKHSSDKHQLPI